MDATPKHWQDEHGFLQRRVARFSLFVAGLVFSLLALRVVVVLTLGRAHLLADWSLPILGSIVLSALVAWRLLLRGGRSEAFIRRVEAIELAAVSWSF